MPARRRVLRKGSLAPLASTSLVLLSIGPRPALAGPDKCVLTQNGTATCTGNQSDGVRENPAPLASDFPTGTRRLTVKDLTRDISTPFTGIKYRFDSDRSNPPTPTGSLEYQGGDKILNAGAIGIAMGKNGFAGANGNNGSLGRKGTDGQPGETWGPATAFLVGTIRSVLQGINVSVTGGAGGVGGSNGGLCFGCTGTHGGSGGSGGKIDVSGSGSVTTTGAGGQGIYLFGRGGNGANGRDGSSPGGGGGNGGAGGAGTIGVSLANSGDWSIATTASGANANASGIRIEVVGGDGGSGGNSRDAGLGGRGARGGDASTGPGVSLGSSLGVDRGAWRISTRGDNSAAVHLSGTGGKGGSSTSQSFGTGFAGGDGGSGGALSAWAAGGGAVEASTLGSNSPGIRLETAGGQGGVAGGGASGGVGGAGGSGGSASVGGRGFTATLSTAGDKSPGVLLYSKGGAGGRGGNGAGTGGNGGAGSTGAILGVTGRYDITTRGSESRGIQAFSFGGDSASGGSGFFGRPGGSDQQRGSEAVNVDVSGTVTTAGAKSSGIDAQSIAGHGGNSPLNIWSFSASAGSAGMGGKIDLKSSATISTAGDQSSAINAASVGGGGGVGGPGFGLLYAVGGSGGIGGDGGIVGVDNGGALTTSGNDAAGIYAQSIGGSGGTGGSAGGFLFSFGGRSQFGGNGGTVGVRNRGAIETGKALPPRGGAPAQEPICGKAGCSAGIFAQSVGGGGGNAGTSVAPFSVGGEGGIGGNGGNVSVGNYNRIRTALENSDAISAQSVGGGGGTGGGSVGLGVAALSVALGGKGGAGGNGGGVTVCNGPSGSPLCVLNEKGGALQTSADHSRGITAESVGGGGGESGFAVSASVGIDIPGIAIAVGGSSRAAGKGGEVFVSNDSDIATAGDDSAGVHAQSTGGGGGTGGFAIAASASNVGAVSVAVGGAGGAAGDGGNVTVFDQDGTDIETQGDSSSGIFAQSTGGGGGKGGVSITAAAAQLGISFSVGRSGGSGGTGGNVGVTQGTGSIQTRGDDSYGIAAQSVGSSGGSGSLAISAAAATAGTTTFAMGGSGGAGGVAGDVDVRNDADVRTRGDRSTGVFAQSVGGGGGDGGLSIAGSVLGEELVNPSANVALGGGAGNGGKAGVVTVRNGGDITAFGERSMGIAAQSVGKGGGTGGLAISGRLANPGARTFGLNFSLGGTGGGGGDAGAVAVYNSGAIRTGGATFNVPTNDGAPVCEHPPCVKQYGISAQSVGGGGGSGGLAGTITAGAFRQVNVHAPSVSLNTAVGGSGGVGGKGGTVLVDNSGAVMTHAAESSAIFAQSVSGGGGDGGQAVNFTVTPGQPDEIKSFSTSVTVGGSGGIGQVGGEVTVRNAGALETTEYASHGLFAQSVGGGGGNGGDAGSFQFTLSCVRGTSICDGAADSEGNWQATATVGGSGGKGNDGGKVTVDNGADVTTQGGGSDAINAASIGGGGGTGGGDSGLTALPSSLFLPPPLDWAISGDRLVHFQELNIAVGGTGGAQGGGGDVSITQRGHVLRTEGPGASGIYAQSVGGGGGTSRLIGAGGTASASGTTPFSVSVGGKAGAGGDGGEVTVDVLDGTRIQTGGEPVYDRNGKLIKNSGSFGIFAQSVGGGGGFGGSSSMTGIPFGSQIPNCDWCGKVSIGIGLPITGAGGAGGNGKAVTVTMEGSIETGSAEHPGESSPGILAQSVGGGGGIAGFSAINPIGVPNLPDVFRGTFMGSANSGGSAGLVSVDFTGDIRTWGAASHGIMAQSAGSGKPAAVASQPSNGGGVQIDFDGTLEASGQGSDGIFAQSNGFDKAGDIEVRIAKGSVVSGGTPSPAGIPGGGFRGAGIELWDGANNVVTNRGRITSLGGEAVFHKGRGGVTVNNLGQMSGNVLLTGGGGNVFNNGTQGILRSALVDLGAGGKLFNDGLLAPGGDGLVNTMRIVGDWIQSSSGRTLIDLTTAPGPVGLATQVGSVGFAKQGGSVGLAAQAAPVGFATQAAPLGFATQAGALGPGTQADLLSVSGDVTLSGDIFVNTVDLQRRSGEQPVAIVRSDGAVTASDLSIRSASGSDVVEYRLLQPTSRELDLAYSVDFAAPGVLARTNDNQDALAQRVQDLYVGDALDPGIANALIDADGASFASALNSMGAEIVVDDQIASLQSSLRFGEELHHPDCRGASPCAWARAGALHFHRDESGDNLGFATTGMGVTGGVQKWTDSGWRVGAAAGYEHGRLDSNSRASSDSDQVHVGVSIGRALGPAELSGSIAAGYGHYDLERRLPVGGDGTLDSAQNLISVGGRVGASWRVGGEARYVKPRIDLSATRLMMPSFDEGGANDFGLHVDSSHATYVAVQPALEIGAAFQPREGMYVRPHLVVGATRFLGGAEPSVNAGFVAPGGVAPFDSHTALDDTVYQLTAGVGVQSDSGLSVQAEGFLGTSAESSGYGGSLMVRIPF